VDGRLTLGALVAFNGYLAHLAWPTIALGWTISILRRGLASMERIQEVMALGAAAAAGPAAASGPLPAAPAIEFRRLTFAYDDGPPVLRDVSFAIDPGETVAVVGPTGSGKSTLGLLLARLREPPPGAVLIDGRDLREVEVSALRRSLGYVPQEAFLFSRSIRDNIAFAVDRPPDAGALEAAARAAGLVDEVETFPDRWETVVGERGLTLSGGQRQRVALARAVLADPRILILDDVFASVDTAKEAEITGALATVAAGRTTLLITHRLRAAQAADRVVVLVEGRVVEEGSPTELIGRGGVYARLWRVQQLEDEIART
jgi:ATP-binding cassette subfamily B protein